MSSPFDPYHKWLAIPAEDQPPTHYRLLAIEAFEDDTEVISNAAEQRISHLRILEMGEQGEIATELIAEITAARDCLLDPETRAAYQEQLDSPEVTESVEAAAPPKERKAGRKKSKEADKKAKRVRLLGHILAPIVGLALGGLILWVIKSMPSEDEKVEIPDWGLQEEAVESEEVTIPDITEPSESEATKADQIGPTDSAVADTDLIDEALGEAAPVSEAPAEEPPDEVAVASNSPTGSPAVPPEPEATIDESVQSAEALQKAEALRKAEEEAAFREEKKVSLELAIENGALVLQLELAEEIADFEDQDPWDRQLQLFEDYQQRESQDDGVTARAALLLADRAALDGRIAEARKLAADALRAARRDQNPRLERMVTLRVLELSAGESE